MPVLRLQCYSWSACYCVTVDAQGRQLACPLSSALTIPRSDALRCMSLATRPLAANRFRKRGLAITPTKFGISFTTKFLNQAGALVHIYTGKRAADAAWLALCVAQLGYKLVHSWQCCADIAVGW